METIFALDHGKLAVDPRFASLAGRLGVPSRIDSQVAFNKYCREACRLWREHCPAGIGVTSAKFAGLLQHVRRGGDGAIRTPWGGVVVTLHEHPRVEKYLVVRQGGYLALERHEQKDEQLEVQEGAGLILWRRSPGQPLTVQPLEPGCKFRFEPGMEHCLIGTENVLLFERSTDPKGMDQDLIFTYEPDVPP